MKKARPKKHVHLDDPQSFRIWTCEYWVRTACTRWLSSESGVTKDDSLVTCPDCLALIAQRGKVEAKRTADEIKKRKETADKVAEARRVALERKREKIKAEQDAREERAKTMDPP